MSAIQSSSAKPSLRARTWLRKAVAVMRAAARHESGSAQRFQKPIHGRPRQMRVARKFDDGRQLAAVHGDEQRQAAFERAHAAVPRLAVALRHGLRPG